MEKLTNAQGIKLKIPFSFYGSTGFEREDKGVL